MVRTFISPVFISMVFLAIIIAEGAFPHIVERVLAAASTPWAQTNWAGGSGQTAWSSATQFSSSSNIDFGTANEITLATSENWFHTSWKFRKKLTFDNSKSSENLTDVPVLIKLTASNFDFSKARSAGQDIRFTDSDGTTTLSYEIERWDNGGQEAWVWVKVPQIDSSSNGDFIYVYYGNTGATDAQSVASTWHTSYTSVWHLKETSSGASAEFVDSTSNALSGQGGGASGVSTQLPSASTSGKIAASQYFANDDYIELPSEASYDFDNASFTVSGWVKSTGNNQMIVTKNSNGSSGGWLVDISSNKLRGTIKGTGGASAAVRSSSSNINDGNWHHFAVVFTTNTSTSASNDVSIYIDGQPNQAASVTRDGSTYASVATVVNLGRRAGNTAYLWGSLDEVRVSNTSRSAEAIEAEYLSGAVTGTVSGDSVTYVAFSTEEAQILTPGVLTSSIYDTEQNSAWGTLDYAVTVPSNTTASVKVRTSNSPTMSGATEFASCTAIADGADVSNNSCVGDGHRYVQYQVTLTNTDGISTPTFTSFSLPFTETTPPATYYFDSVSGNDSANGLTPETAWKTLSKFNGRTFQPGETVRFKRGGVWDGGAIINESGTSGQRITISDYGTGTKPIFRDTTNDEYERAFEIGGSYITIENVKIDDARSAAIEMFENASNNIIRYIDVSNSGIGVTIKGDSNTVTGSTFQDLAMVRNTVGGFDDYGAIAVNLNADSQVDKEISDTELSYNSILRAKAPSHDYGYDGGFVEIFGGMDNITIFGNLVRDSKGFIEIGSAPEQNNTVQNVYMYNNVSYNNGLFMFVNSGLYEATISNIVVQNNTIYDRSSQSSQFFFDNGAPDGTQFILRNNILYGRAQFVNCNNVLPNDQVGCGDFAGDFTHTNNIYWRVTGTQIGYTPHSSEYQTDAILVATGSGDLRIRPASIAVNNGYATGYTEDFNRTARPQGTAIDIGAYEFSIASAPASLALYRSNGTTALSTGEWYNADDVVAKFQVSSYNPEDALTPKVEVKALGLSFNGTSLRTGSVVNASGSAVLATVNLSDLTDGEYHWRASSTNVIGTSSYTVYGENAESARDFGIDTTAPVASSISIEAGASTVQTDAVTITLSATDATSGVSEMMLSESSSFTGASWESYNTSKSFTLSGGGGLKTVYVKFRDAAGNESSTLSDTITYDIPNTPPDVPTSLGPTELVTNIFGNDSTPTLTFTLADDDAIDTIKYQIQIDDTADFSTVLIDYTSPLDIQGAQSFTVGQAAGSGSYAVGSASQTLSNGSYYWRVRATDVADNTSAYATANSGSIAFKIDLTAPSAPADLTATTPSLTGINATWSAVTDALSGISHYIWTILNGVGEEIDSAITSGLSYARSLSEGVYTFIVVAVDNAGNMSSQSSTEVIVDLLTPTISNVSASVTASTSATVTWTTDDSTSSRVRYGIGGTSALATSLADTSPRVTSHTVSLTGLASCATYAYVVESVDVASKIATSSPSVFTTTGCLGSASVADQEEAPVTEVSGGTTTLSFTGGEVELVAPPAIADTDTVIQIKRIDTDAVITAAPYASVSAVVPGYTFDFSALTATGSAIHDFEEPIDVTIQYATSVATAFYEDTLFIAHWSGSEWEPLDDCSVNTSTREISCSTTGFSTFAIFGTEKPDTPTPTPSPSSNNNSNSGSSGSGSSGSGSGGSSTPGPCTNQPPNQAPHLFEIRRLGAKAELYFTPVQPLTSYTVSYGVKPDELIHGFSWDTSHTGGAVKVMVDHLDPKKPYTFKVRGSNGCMPGNWSNALTVQMATRGWTQFFPSKVSSPMAKTVTSSQRKVTQTKKQDARKATPMTTEAAPAPSAPAPQAPSAPAAPTAPAAPQEPAPQAPSSSGGFLGWVKKILKW